MPRKREDLSGQVFGRLTAISPTEERAKNRSIIWECECSCGGRKKASSASLKSGSAKSCGCYVEKKTTMKDLRGQKFGLLTAISPTEERKKTAVIWECECECGGRKKVPSRYLLQGKTKSCGCERIGGVMIDLSGQTFGKLTAIAPTGEKLRRRIVWECICSCGEKKEVSSLYLLNGSVKSCGCYQESKTQQLTVGQTIGHLTIIALSEEKLNGCTAWECECSCGERKKISDAQLFYKKVKCCGCRLNREKNDLSGETFGRLTVISPTKERINGSVVWECVCSCGESKKVSAFHLAIGDTKSCGCLGQERALENIEKARERFYVEGTNLTALTRKANKTNKSGIKGVHWDKSKSKWMANIGHKGKTIYLGRFKNIEDAAAARKAAEEKYFRPVLEKYQDRLTSNQIAKYNSEYKD